MFLPYLDFLNLIMNLLPFFFFTLILIPFAIPPNSGVLYRPSLLSANGSMKRIDWPDLKFVSTQTKKTCSSYLRSTIGGFIASIWAANSAAEGTVTEEIDSGDCEEEEEGTGGFLWLLDIWLFRAPGTIGMSITAGVVKVKGAVVVPVELPGPVKIWRLGLTIKACNASHLQWCPLWWGAG